MLRGTGTRPAVIAAIAAIACVLGGCDDSAAKPPPTGVDVQHLYQNDQYDKSDTSDDER